MCIEVLPLCSIGPSVRPHSALFRIPPWTPLSACNSSCPFIPPAQLHHTPVLLSDPLGCYMEFPWPLSCLPPSLPSVLCVYPFPGSLALPASHSVSAAFPPPPSESVTSAQNIKRTRRMLSSTGTSLGAGHQREKCLSLILVVPCQLWPHLLCVCFLIAELSFCFRFLSWLFCSSISYIPPSSVFQIGKSYPWKVLSLYVRRPQLNPIL